MLGSGTIGDPYIIENATDWNAVSASDSYRTAHFALNGNINFGGANLNCWYWHDGTAVTRFTGTFDGRGYTLSNANFVAIQKNGVWSYTAAIHITEAGSSIHDITFDNCTATGVNQTNANQAGILRTIVGNVENVLITNCTLAGFSQQASPIVAVTGTATNCHSRGCTITGTNIAGLIVTAGATSIISKCSAVGNNMTGTSVFGFAFANTTGCVIQDCYTRASTITGSTTSAGFTAMSNSSNGGKVVRCYAANTIAGAAANKHAFTPFTYDNFLSTDNFWDNTLYASADIPFATGLTTADMKSRGGIITTLGEEYIYPINEYPKFAGQPAENPITVTYNGNGNTAGAAPASQTGESGYYVAKRNTLEKSGAIFTYWNTAANGSGTTYLANSIITTATTLYAQYQTWSRSVNAYFGAESTTDGTFDWVGDKQGAVLQNVGDVIKIALRCASGKKSAAQLIVYAPVDCKVSKDGITYADSVTFAAGEITDENAFVWAKRVSANVLVTQDIGFLTSPALETLGVVNQ